MLTEEYFSNIYEFGYFANLQMHSNKKKGNIKFYFCYTDKKPDLELLLCSMM